MKKARPEDLGTIKKIADLLYIEMSDFVWNTEGFIRKQIERGEYYAIEIDGQMAGIISFRDRNSIFYIETLAVAKDIQTKGIGSKLVEFAKDFARKNNFKKMRTTSFYEYGVNDFWIKQGFRLLEEPGEYGGHKFYRFQFDL